MRIIATKNRRSSGVLIRRVAMQFAGFRMSMRHMMIVIAVIGFATFAVRKMFFASTVYSAGYDESRFRQVRVGMTSAEVEALLGPPLRTLPWWPDQDLMNWKYTDSRPRTSNYWMRDVFVKDGKVVKVVSMYWID
jgi:hypothetical protein